MGPRALSAAALTAVLAGAVVAQGPLYRERWGYLHLELRRHELLQALRGADAAALQRTAELLTGPDRGIPFAPVAAALAAARGAEADGAFLLRTMLSVFVLPEVADPDGSNELCRRTNVSLFLPLSIELPGRLVFDFEVTDAAGERVWAARLDVDPDVEDLRLARPVAPIPSGEFPDGRYEVRVATRIGDAAPGSDDPVLVWPFHVLRGYQQRSEAALAAFAERADALAGPARAALTGLAAEVQRAYGGEAWDVASDAVRDLERLERALRNVADERAVLAGLSGDVPVRLEVAEPRGLAAVVRLPEDFEPGEARERPLVVFAAATPSYDLSPRRPGAPTARGPRWLAHELRTFGSGLACDVAWLESPGEVPDYATNLARALAALRQLFGTGSAPLLLVADGEAAAIAGLHVQKLAPMLQGLVLVGAGAMTGPAIDALGALPVRVQPLPAHPGSEGLRRVLAYAEGRDGDVARLDPRELPWPLALPLLQDQIEAFAQRVFAGAGVTRDR